MNEEAGFIAALLADPDDRTALLVYADWLQERDDPRAEYLRLLVAEKPNVQRLSRLRRKLDHQWRHVIDTRHLRPGVRVRICGGSFDSSEGTIRTVTDDRQIATVRVTFWRRPLDVEIQLSQLEFVSPAP